MGLPRPLYKGKPLPWSELDLRLTPFGDPIDEAHDDPRLDYYWTSPLQDGDKLDEAWSEGLCVLCGEALDDPVFFFTRDMNYLAQGGLHERCAKLTEAHCPGIQWAGHYLGRATRSAWDELRSCAPSPGRGDLWLAPCPSDWEDVWDEPSHAS